MTTENPSGSGTLERRLGLTDAVVVGLAAMLGAGVFVAFVPAARAAGELLFVSLAIAAVVAGANALSSARLAARYPESGGAYVYGRERLGMPWGHLAGWAFVVGKTASCAAMALTLGAYLAPDAARLVACLTVLGVLVLNLQGIQRTAKAASVIVLVVILTLVAFVATMLLAPPAILPSVPGRAEVPGVRDVIQGAGFLFFAFAGYARIATMGEEVREPRRTIPAAIVVALTIVIALYALIAAAFLFTVSDQWLSARVSPLAEAAEISELPWLGPVIRVVAGIAAIGALLALVLGVSRTVLAMARDLNLPRALARVDERGIPARAEITVTIAIIVLVVLTDLRGAIGFSSFCVLTYYAIANASAWTLSSSWRSRVIPVVGLFGCVVIALSLPWASVATGAVILAIGAVIGWFRKAARDAGSRPEGG